MSAIRRGSPPPVKPSSGRRKDPRLVELAEACRAEPGEWFGVDWSANRSTAAAMANHIRRGSMSLFSDGQWESCSRTIDGRGHVFARIVDEAAA